MARDVLEVNGMTTKNVTKADSRELAESLFSLGNLLRALAPDARSAASFLKCSRRTARRALTYARRLAETRP